uniref:Uncharacterized protein n=1 Tax=Rhizophora mucronata TaxID=61149 RepID=A0A2P2IMG2_RHIMU
MVCTVDLLLKNIQTQQMLQCLEFSSNHVPAPYEVLCM